jgi:integrase
MKCRRIKARSRKPTRVDVSMLSRNNLEAYLDAYIEAAGIRDGGKSPLFRSAVGRTGTLTATAMNRVDAWRMIQRRAAELGTRVRIGCHTFRATGITAYLEAGGTLENAQAMAAHESPRTTKTRSRSTRWSVLRYDTSNSASDTRYYNILLIKDIIIYSEA